MTKDVKIVCASNSYGSYKTYISGGEEKWKEGELITEVKRLVDSGYEPISIGGAGGGRGDIKNSIEMCVLMIKR